MPQLTRHPGVWLCGWLGWFGLLWFFSSLEGTGVPSIFPHIDKLQHFGYFAGGGFLFAGWRFTRKPDTATWKSIIVCTIVVIALVGVIDEWHQTYTPGRSGADPWDWLADLLGGAAGAFALKSAHRRIRKNQSGVH